MELWLTVTRAGLVKGQVLDEIGEVLGVSSWPEELAIDSTVDVITGVVVTNKYPAVDEKSKAGYAMRPFEILEGEMIITGDEFYFGGTWSKAKIQKAMRDKTSAPTPIADKAPEVPAPVEAAPQNADALSQLIAQNQQLLNMLTKQQS
jgi:hypothetical protein